MGRSLKAILVVLTALLFLVASSCGPAATPTPTPTARPAKTMKIAFGTVMSGALASWGKVAHRAMELALEDINTPGGVLVGGERYKIEVIEEDHAMDPKKGLAIAQKYIALMDAPDRPRVLFTIGGSIALAIAPVAEKEKVLQLIIGGAPPGLPSREYSNTFLAAGAPMDLVAEAFYDWYLAEYPDDTRFALITLDAPVGVLAFEKGTKVLKAAGKEIVYSAKFPPATVDFYPMLTPALAKNPQMIDISYAFSGQFGVIIKQARELGFKGRIVSSATGTDPADLIAISGKQAAEGYIFATGIESSQTGPVSQPKERELRDRYIAKYGEFNVGAALFGQAFPLLAQGVEKANSWDVEKIKEAFYTYEFDSPTGKYRFGLGKLYEVPNVFLGSINLNRIRNGQIETFWRVPLGALAKKLGE